MKHRRLIYIGIVLGIVIVVILSNIMMRNSYIKSVELNIDYPSKDRVIDKKEIEQDLVKHFGNFLKIKRKDIEVNTIRQYLESKNFVESASVSVSITGVLKIFVSQRLAVVRVFAKNNHTYYIDKDMHILKVEVGKTVDVLVANGNITDKEGVLVDSLKNKQLFEIYTLSMLINEDSILKYQIDQVVRKDTAYILVPKIGEYEVVLGEKKDWREELLRLHWLYIKAFLKNGWENYSQIDLRFKNQVICTRKQKNDNL